MSRSWSSNSNYLLTLMDEETEVETEGETPALKPRGFTTEDILNKKILQQKRNEWLKSRRRMSVSYQSLSPSKSQTGRRWSPQDLKQIREEVIQDLKPCLEQLSKAIQEENEGNDKLNKLLANLQNILREFMFSSDPLLGQRDLGKKCITEIQNLEKKHQIQLEPQSTEKSLIIKVLFIISAYSRVQEYLNNVYEYVGSVLSDRSIQKTLDYLFPSPVINKKAKITSNAVSNDNHTKHRIKVVKSAEVLLLSSPELQHNASTSKSIEQEENRRSSSPFSLSKSCSLPVIKGDKTKRVVCRMCETEVDASMLEEHSKYCVKANALDMFAFNQEFHLAEAYNAIQEYIKLESQNCTDPELQSKFNVITENLKSFKDVNWEYLIEKLKSLPSNDQLNQIIDNISYLLTLKSQALKKAEQIFQSSPAMIRTDSPRRLLFSNTHEKMDGNKSKSNLAYENVPTISDFKIVKTITEGAFGRVFLARKKRTDDLYAIKVLRKSDMIQKNQVRHVRAERNILAFTENPFIIKMYYAFQSDKYLYLVLEYAAGGDCFSLLHKFGGLDESVAKMYIAETVLALEYLHSKGIVHRDLKPDNMLINSKGHIKLTDFGLSSIGLAENIDLSKSATEKIVSSVVINQTDVVSNKDSLKAKRSVLKSGVGTPDYLAPEILLGIGHSFPVDWWSLGVVLYEFLCGLPPFYSDTREITFQNILNLKINWDDEISLLAKDLIISLLRLKPEDRPNAQGVKKHPFFAEIHWETLLTAEPPFIPQLDHEESTEYYDPRLDRFPLVDSGKFSNVYDDSGQATFDDPTFGGFWFINFNNLLSKNMEVVHHLERDKRRTKSF